MLDSMAEIKSNPVVNRFNEIARAYGVHGIYVSWCPGGLNDDGIYFVCGLDKAKISQKSIDMHKIIDNMRRAGSNIRTDICAFRIDKQQPLMVHRHIVNYCQQLDTLQNVYGHFGESIPPKMAPGVIEIMDVAWRHFTNTEKSSEMKAAHEKTLKQAINIVKKDFDTSSPEYKKYQYLANGYYDSGRGKIYNWAKKHFAQHKNEVSLSHLVNHSGKINFATISYASYPQVKKALEQRPDILYHFSNVRGKILDVKGEEGFGSKEENDRRYYTLHYPTAYTKDIEKILLEINYPTEFHRTIEDVDPNGYGTEYVVVPDEYFEMFKNLCDKNNVKICIDHSARSTVYGGIPVAFSAEHSSKTYAMLNASVKRFEGDISPKFQLEEGKNEIKEPFLSSTNYCMSDLADR